MVNRYRALTDERNIAINPSSGIPAAGILRIIDPDGDNIIAFPKRRSQIDPERRVSISPATHLDAVAEYCRIGHDSSEINED